MFSFNVNCENLVVKTCFASKGIESQKKNFKKNNFDRYSIDMLAETWSTYQPTSTNMHVGRHPANTSPPLGRYLTDTRPTLRSFAQLSLLSSIFSILLRGAFSGRRPFLAFNSGNIHVFFSAMFYTRHHFYIRPSLLLEVAAFGACRFGGSLF